jgi:hypothetical protein
MNPDGFLINHSGFSGIHFQECVSRNALLITFELLLKSMKEIIQLLRSHKVYVLIMALFFTAFAVMEAINKRFWLHDFQVYYDAATHFSSGKTVYGIAFGLGSGYYKYSPFALFIFFPLTLVHYDVAKVIYFIFLSLLIMITVIVSDRLVKEKLLGQHNTKPRLIILFLITIAFVQHIYYELHLGNINILLLLLSLLALHLVLKKKEWAAGLFLTLAILIKPHFVILIPLLFLRKRFVTIVSCIAGIVFGLLIPSLYAGFSANMQLLGEWKETMLQHNISPVKGQDTIYSWLYRVSGSSIAGASQNIFVLSVLVFTALLIFAFIIYNQRREAEITDNKGLGIKNSVFEYLVLLALIPNLTVTDSEHFLFSVPLIAWVINYLFIRKPGYLLSVLVIIILFLYGGNLREAIGAPASKWMTTTGILGLGNLLLIGMSIYMMLVNPGKPDKINSL